jgi:hypothetical protein
MSNTITGNTFTYTLTPEQLQEVRATLKSQGLDAEADKGEITTHNCTFSYEYVEPALTVTELHKSVFVPGTMIKAKLDSWFGQFTPPTQGSTNG